MKIVELRAENFKRLKAVEIRPDGDVVVIAGRNAMGKSSVLDAIWAALAGAAGAKETSRPIRDGEKQASVELNLGDLVVTRRWTEKGTTLAVAAADGAKYPSPQKVLDELIGRLTFDPLAFADASQKDQLATLLSVVELPFDPEKLAMERQGVFDQRTDVNREVKRLEGALSAIEPPPDDTPDEEVSAAGLATELEAATRANRVRGEAQSEFAKLAEQRDEIERRMGELEIFLNESGDIDTSGMRERLEAADGSNAAVRAKQQRGRIEFELARARDESAKYTESLEAMDNAKALALSRAQMPLDGLSFDDEGVLFKGIPLSQVSDSERLRVSIAIAIALNPKIRVIRITDGSLLDSENMALIAGMAAEHDFQCWIERVDETGEVGITIEDGQVV